MATDDSHLGPVWAGAGHSSHGHSGTLTPNPIVGINALMGLECYCTGFKSPTVPSVELKFYNTQHAAELRRAPSFVGTVQSPWLKTQNTAIYRRIQYSFLIYPRGLMMAAQRDRSMFGENTHSSGTCLLHYTTLESAKQCSALFYGQ